MFNKIRNNIWLGLGIGLLLPAIAFLIVSYIKIKFPFLKNDDLLYIACVAINLIPVMQAFKFKKEQLAQGIVGATFVCALIFTYYKLFFKI